MGQQNDKKFQAHVTLGKSSEAEIQKDQTEFEIQCSYQPRSDSTPYDFTLMTSANIARPTSKWNKEQMLSQNIGGQVNIQAHYGLRGQKQYAEECQKAKKCQEQNQQGEKLTEECKQARECAASVDKFDTSVKMPSYIAQNRYVKTTGEICKAFFSLL